VQLIGVAEALGLPKRHHTQLAAMASQALAAIAEAKCARPAQTRRSLFSGAKAASHGPALLSWFPYSLGAEMIFQLVEGAKEWLMGVPASIEAGSLRLDEPVGREEASPALPASTLPPVPSPAASRVVCMSGTEDELEEDALQAIIDRASLKATESAHLAGPFLEPGRGAWRYTVGEPPSLPTPLAADLLSVQATQARLRWAAG
jgi:hypothetical protein